MFFNILKHEQIIIKGLELIIVYEFAIICLFRIILN